MNTILHPLLTRGGRSATMQSRRNIMAISRRTSIRRYSPRIAHRGRNLSRQTTTKNRDAIVTQGMMGWWIYFLSDGDGARDNPKVDVIDDRVRPPMPDTDTSCDDD